jgi:hypothetical protein
MKKIWFLVTILTLFGLFFATTQVFASPPAGVDAKRTPDHTPGAQATKRADEKATQGIGNPQGGGNGGNPHGNNPQNGANALGKRVNYQGTIAAVNASSLTLTLSDGTSPVFVLTAGTIIKIPTMGNSGTVADLLVGMKVNVHATQDNAGVLTALIVQVVPGKPALVHRVGTVTDYQPGVSITILAQDGKPYTFLVTAKTKILPPKRAALLAVGARVTVIARRDVTGGPLTAMGIVVHPTGTGKTPTP